ncbi:c-type cytochrome [Rhodovulum euryhalinum]|nr:cytochrome C [Rhodovulum euryhalinum]
MPAHAGPEAWGPETNYVLRCIGCHGADGAGSADVGIPDFRGYVGSFSASEAGRRYLMHVPGVTNASLTDTQIAEVMNHVMERFAGASLPADYRPFTPAEVTALRAERVGDVVALRRTVAADLTAAGLPVAGYPWP